MKRWFFPIVLTLTLWGAPGCTLADDLASPLPVASHPAAPPPAGVERIPQGWLPGLNEVAAVHLAPGAPLPAGEAPHSLHASHPGHRTTIAWLLDELAGARLAQGQISPPLRAPVLKIALKSGGAVSVRLAYDCTPFTGQAGNGYTCRQVAGQLILHSRQGQEVRITHARMASWLMGGWKADIPVGPVPDMDKETALEIARRVDARSVWQARFYPEYPVETKGGTEVHRVWVLEAESPGGSRTCLVVDARTGEVLRLERLEALQ